MIDLPDTASERVMAEINKFSTPETKARYEKYGLVYKRGIFMHGKQGTGKTCTIVKVIEKTTTEGGIVLFNPQCNLVAPAVKAIRELDPNVSVLVIFEEFETIAETDDMLSLLDGQNQVDNIVFLATTNYISRIPARIKSRPSRFATVIEVGVPSKEARIVYFNAKLADEDKKHLNELVEKTEGFVIDQLKDIIVSVFCLGLSIDEAVLKILEMEHEGVGDSDMNEALKVERFASWGKMLMQEHKNEALNRLHLLNALGNGEVLTGGLKIK